ncbi:hypothetical protein LAZ67_9001873 [Cordylochernes scorpioides]|uniref:RNA-directed DNA polymerase n=1 Tax=Cordylochernes scorpioides TaxID=51811 RepID=A0ABY6KTD2_9ARAC|nr:hypothetical protein LAZ67_9001873 [Cordylochernes scorpioides]
MVETRSGKMQDPVQERIKAEESAKPQPGATIGRDASFDPVVLNPNIDIPKYDGTEDPRPWIESLEEIGFLYHWADYIISRYAAMNMTGSAKTWLNLHKASFTSWENIKIRLIQDFSLDANKEELRMKLNRMQHWNEPAIRFAEDILVLCNKVDPAMEEETKIEHVIGGLKKEYSFALYLNPPKTTDNLLVVCKKMDSFEKKYRERVEKSRNLYNGPRYSRPQQQSRYVPPTAARNYQTTSRPQAPVSNNYKNDSPPTPRQYRNNFPQPSTPRRPYNPNFVPKPNLQRNTYNKSQEVSKNRTEDGRPICFKCNKPGHVARYCRVKFIRILEEDPADTQEKIFRVGGFKLSVAPESVNQSKSTINGIKKLDPKYKLKINVDKIGTFEALVDTGADLSVVDLRTALDTGHGISKLAKICAGPDGKKLDMVGSIFLNIKIDDETLSHNFVILKTHLRTLILGRDFLKKMNAKIDCKQETIKYDLTNNHDEINFEMLKIKSAKDSIVPECSMKLIKALVETEDGEYIIEESSKMFQTNGLRLARSLINVINRETHIWITNPYPRPLKIMKNQTLAFGSSPAKINVSREREVEKNEEPRFQINENLPPKEQKELKQVLERYGDLFSSRLGRTNLAKHRIDTEDAKPIKHKPYRVSAKERDIIKEQIDEMLTEGIIRPSSSPWSFPVILVKKRDGKYRFCVDYRKLNNVTVKDVYPIPRIDEVMDTLQGSTHFSAIDLRSGYWQVEVEERDKEKTAFTTAHGLYEFNVMPFGLCNAPATFERNMENMLGNLRWQICLCYLDDVIIYSPDFPTHLKRLEAVFRCFRESNLRLNDKKCRFAFEELEILGYITSKHGIKPAEHNIKAVRNFPRPKKVKEVQSFLGMCSYYRKFIKDFSKIADPLTNLIKKSVSFTWTERQEEAFQTLKTALLSPPILGHFNPNAPTYVHTDASNIGIGATLVQDIGGEEKVISYLSRTLSKAEQNYSTTEKECLAVVWSMSKLRPYLYGRHFKIVTDHHALCWLKNLKDPTGRLARWALKIQEYDFDIIHKSGKKHLDADGLSRGPLPETDWDEDFERLFLNQITDEEDKFIESVKKNLNGSRRSIAQNFKEEDGCLFKKNPNPEGRAWLLVVPENKKREIMKEYHNHMSNGHLGVARTMYRIKSKYFWPSMLKDVSEFVKTCHLCQSRKGSNQLPSGLLQPIPPANFPFERIGIDFVGPLPSTKNRKKWIIVLTDYYTRYAETRAVSEATVKEVSKFLVEDIFLRHGAPQYLISDRGSQFTSNLMKEVMKTCKIKHCFTTSYHPQTNGLTERLNRTLINMLSMYVNTDQKNWDEILPFITHAYNTTIQETTGYSPFFLMFGREPTSLLDDRNISVDIDKDDYDEYIKHHLDKINRTRKLVINNTIKTQERMKKNYDKKHMERSYEPGELVAVWTPIRKIGKCEKLLRKYFGPYRIIKKLSNVNYLIEPKDNPGQDPLIVHVSRLKPYFERIDEVTHEDVTTSGEGEVPPDLWWMTWTYQPDSSMPMGKPQAHDWQVFYRELLCSNPTKVVQLPLEILDIDPELDCEISLTEVTTEISKLGKNKATGLDEIPNEAIKYLLEEPTIYLRNLFNKILGTSQIPQQWTKTIIHPIFKNGDPVVRITEEHTESNYRGISLISNLSKLFTSILKTRLNDWMERKSILAENQGCKDYLAIQKELPCIIRTTTDQLIQNDQMKIIDSTHFSHYKFLSELFMTEEYLQLNISLPNKRLVAQHRVLLQFFREERKDFWKENGQNCLLCKDLVLRIPLSEESFSLTTFLTPFGRYRFKRLPFGISSAPEVFQRKMSNLLESQSGVNCHMDDIVIWGATQEEHDERLRCVLRKLQDSGLTLNKEKYIFSVKEIKFLGHLITERGVLPDPNKVQAIREFPSPSSISEVRRFLGMVNFTDASSYGLGAVLLQKSEDGYQKAVAYASRTMSETEKRWAQIEKESLAIVWAYEMTPRILRLRLRMMRYSYSIHHTPGKNIVVADALSRSPIKISHEKDLENEIYSFVQQITSCPPFKDENMKEIWQYQNEERECREIKDYCEKGWPTKNELSAEARAFWFLRYEMSVIDGLLMRNSRIYIPKSLRSKVLNSLHEGHLGIEKCRGRARSSVWWPRISQEIGELVRNCPNCIEERSNPQQPLIVSDFPSRPWEKVGIDHFYLKGKYYLLIAGYYSRFPELALLEDRTTHQQLCIASQSLLAMEYPKRLDQITDHIQLQSRIPDLENLEMREKNQRHKKKTHFDIHHRARELPHLDEVTRVWVKDLRVPGVVLEDAGSPRSYIVNSPKGILRRNRFHLLLNPQVEKIDMEDKEMKSPEMSQCFTSTGDNTTCDSEPRTFQRSPEPVKTRTVPTTRGPMGRLSIIPGHQGGEGFAESGRRGELTSLIRINSVLGVMELRRSRRLQGREPILQPMPQRIEMEDDHRPIVNGSYLPCQRQRDPSTFSGDGNINPGQWLKEYERVSKYNRWDETMKLANVVFYLNGTAGRWFDNNEESLNSWRSFEDAFRGVFGLQEDSARRAEEVLKSRAQKAEESSESYIQEILSLCHQVNPRMEEGEIVAHIIKGISEDTYQVLVAKDIQTVDEILKFCRHLTTVKQRRIGRTKFARLSNVMPISCVDDSDDLAGLIRRIVREEIQKVFSAPEVINPLREVNALEQTVREEVSRALQPTRPQVNVVQQQPRTPYYNIDRPTQPRKTEHWRTYDDKPICFHCGRPGHVIRYCRERRQVFAEARTRNGGEGRNVGFSSRPPRYDADDDYPRKVASPNTIPVASPSFQPFSQASECEKLSGAASNGGEVAIEENPPGYIAAKLKENFVMVEINGRKIKALVDSGADFSVISDKFRRELKTPLFKEPGPILKAANKNLIETIGKCVLNIVVNGLNISFEFVVMVECSHDIIFGWDFFKATEAVIDCGRNELHLGETPPLIESSDKLQETQLKSREWSKKINLTLDPGLSEIQRLQLVSCLDEFIDIFDFGSTPIKPTSTVKHKINTGDHSSIKQRPYRVAPSERRLIQDEVNKMIENHIVKPSESPWSSPVILVRKKDGTWRFCVDYRRLNKITKKDVYPLPRIDDALDSLAGSSYFSTMDLRSGYWQIEVDEKDREKTAFITPDGLLKWNMCLCYLDDIVVYAPTFEEHLRRLQLVLRCIQKAGLNLNHKKCLFGSRRIKILGHLVDANGIHPDPDKVEAVSKFPRPKNISELRSFLGLCSYYRRFIENFADKARSLHDLLKTEKQFYWDAAQEKAFEVLKTALISEPVLGHFDESADTHLHTDASGHGIGAVLLQIQGGKERPIAYASRSLTKAENNYSTTEKECLAVVWSISKFRPYLFGRPFTVVTDHHSLCWLVGQKDPSGRLARWALKLQEFDVTVIYKSGRKHKDADCLSRSPLENDQPSAVMSLTNVDIEQTKDPDLAKIIDNLNSGYTRKEFSIIDGILYKKNYSTTGRPWLMMIPKHLRSEVMADLHDAPIAGHLGFARTYVKGKNRFYWPGLYRTVRQYVSNCRECQRRKKLPRRPAGQLVSIPPVEKPFYKVGVDLLGRFPVSKDGNRWIIVCTDYMTRYAITKAIPDGGAIETAKFLVEDVILKHGAPREMITDRGRNFISQVIKEINALCGIVHRFTTAYHPQTNGLTERFNKTLGDMLSMYTGVEQKDWDQVLPYVTFAYNTAKQEATGYTTFFLVHAREAETYIDAVLPYLPDEISDDFIGELVTRAEEARQLSRSRLLQSQAKDRRLYDQKYTPVYYQKDDLVWVFTPIRKVGLSEKLLKRYFGPYRVTKKLSEVTYEVEPVDPSPRSRKAKDIVHVIRMKPYLDPEEQHSILLGNTSHDRFPSRTRAETS